MWHLRSLSLCVPTEPDKPVLFADWRYVSVSGLKGKLSKDATAMAALLSVMFFLASPFAQ